MICSILMFASCSRNDFGDADVRDGMVTFSVAKSYLADTVTRTCAAPETTRRILSDGLLVDAALSDATGATGTRAAGTSYETVPDGSTGVAFVCDGTGIIKTIQDITVASQKITVLIPGTDTYSVYFYLNEKGNLNHTHISGASVGANISGAMLKNRAQGSLDDYASISNVSVQNADLGTLTFTPVGSEVCVTTNAGITPITGFETTLNGIQAGDADIKISDGTCTPSSTSAAPGLSLTNDNSVTANRADVTTMYATTLTSNKVRFFSSDQTALCKATLTINSISGPDGSSDNYKKVYNSGNTMSFSTTYKNGHRYDLVLNLATPINGYEEVVYNSATSKYESTGTIAADKAGTACAMGNPADPTPAVTPRFSASAAWPCPIGRPQYYGWDAQRYFPANGTFTDYADYSKAKRTDTPSNPEASALADASCKNCPTYNQISWYLYAGTYWDDGRWYCPNGFLSYTKEGGSSNNILVHTGGRWFKKLSEIAGYADASLGNQGKNPAYNSDHSVFISATTLQTGKPGVVKLTSDDKEHQSPCDWFFLPAAGGWNEEDLHQNLNSSCKYWSCVPYKFLGNPDGAVYAYSLLFSNIKAIIDCNWRGYGACLWIAQ